MSDIRLRKVIETIMFVRMIVVMSVVMSVVMFEPLYSLYCDDVRVPNKGVLVSQKEKMKG